MNVPLWVSEGSAKKYHRALKEQQSLNAQLRAQNKPVIEITEESTKALYVKYAGLVLDVKEEEETEVEAPRRGRRSAE